MARPAIDLSRLSTEEKLDLIGEIWDSLESASIALGAEQLRELDRRDALVDSRGPVGDAWENVEARVRARPR